MLERLSRFRPSSVPWLASQSVLYTSSAIRCVVCFILDRIRSVSVETRPLRPRDSVGTNDKKSSPNARAEDFVAVRDIQKRLETRMPQETAHETQ